MALSHYESYFKRFINKIPASLISPRLFETEQFSLPKHAVLHYLPASIDDQGPAFNNPVFKNVSKLIGAVYVDNMVVPEGVTPKIIPGIFSSMIRKYHAENKKIKRIFDLKTGLKDPESPLIVNYCYCYKRYRYPQSPKKEFYNSCSWLLTIIREIERIYKVSDESYHFLFVDNPLHLPTLNAFNQINKSDGGTNAKRFESLNDFIILNLYNLVSTDQDLKYDYFAKLPNRILDKVNIVFTDSGYYTILNLGTLLSWVKSVDNPQGVNPFIMRSYILRFVLSLMKVRSEDIEELVGNANKADHDNLSVKDALLKEIKGVDSPPEEEDKSIRYDAKTDSVVYDAKVLTPSEKQQLELIEQQLEEQLSTSEKILAKKKSKSFTGTVKNLYNEKPTTAEEILTDKIDDLADSGAMSPSEYRRLEKLIEKTKSIEIEGIPIEEYIKVSAKDIAITPEEIPDHPDIKDKHQLKSTLIDMDRKYTDSLMYKDIAAMFVNAQKGGIFITDVKTADIEDSTGIWTEYTLKISPLKGKNSTVKFKVPKISDEGTYINGGNEYRLRKQKTDLPIRKISSVRVALSSSYGKIFVDRSEKRAHNYQRWLNNTIRASAFDKNNSRITGTRTGNYFRNDIKLPYLYTGFAKEFKTFTIDNLYFYFDYNTREKRLGEVKEIEGSDYVACGISKDKSIILMDYNNDLYLYEEGTTKALPPIETLLGVNAKKAPMDTVELNLMGKSIPLGILLGYKLGFTRLIKLLGVSYRIDYDFKIPLTEKEYAIAFKDCRYVFEKKDRMAALILSGFNSYKQDIRDFNGHFFDEKDVYFAVLDGKRVADRYLREMDLLWDLFIDPITLRLLEQMGEPKTFRGLLFRATELLLTDDHPDEISAYMQRLRGYERIPSIVYNEFIRALRMHNSRNLSNLSYIDINPNEIQLKFLNDPGVVPVKGLNPFQNLRQSESITYTGIGGRSKESMVMRTRKYDEGDIGVVSESTPDSGDVGINAFLSANPQIDSVYGTTKPLTKEVREGKKNIPAMMSSVFNTLPGLDHDDPKRIIFASIQADANVSTVGYRSMPLRTGYESIIPYRVGKLFCSYAREDGKVIALNDNEITIDFKGSPKTYLLGRQYGKEGDYVAPHFLRSDFKLGDTVKKGDIIAYNTSYFEKDPLDESRVVAKFATLANVAILENSYTLEDGGVIAKDFAKRLGTYQTKIRHIRLDFNQQLHNVVKEGDALEADDLLCIIEDEVTTKSKLFDSASIAMLKQLASKAPKAKFKGKVEKIEVFYQGELDEMSESLKQLAMESNRKLNKIHKAKGFKSTRELGKVGHNYLVEGAKIDPNTCVVSFYITGFIPAGTGDKAVFANQMKTTFGTVLDHSPVCEDGEVLDALFGARSISARIVNSPYLIGTTNTLLVEIGKKAFDMAQFED